MSRSFLTFVLMSALSFLLATPTHASPLDTGTLRCGYIVWQPFVMKDANTGQLSGLSYDVFEALGQTLGLKIEWTSEVIVGQEAEALNTGKVDAICGSWPLNSASAKFIDYIDAYAYMPLYLYEKKGGKKFKTLKDINNPEVSISGMDGDISLLVANKKFPLARKVQVPTSADPTEINLNVLTGKADLVANDPFSLGYFNAANKEMLVPVLADKPLVTLKTSGAVKKGEISLLQTLNEGMEILITSGEVSEILGKWDPQNKMMKRPSQPWKD